MARTDLGAFGEPERDGFLSTITLSPDGRRVAFHRRVGDNSDIWVLDGTRMSRFTFDPAVEGYPLGSPDGRQLVFRSRRTGRFDLYQKPSSGAGREELLLESALPVPEVALGWSRGGRFLLLHSEGTNTVYDLLLLPLAEGRPSGPPTVYLSTPFSERFARFSPDGNWVAYTSDETGRDEIYLRPFHEPGSGTSSVSATAGVWQVSTTGGMHPRWRADGRELYYTGAAGEMMMVPVETGGSQPTLGSPVKLFATRIVGGGLQRGLAPSFDVAPDGRFLVNVELSGADMPITLIQHWNPAGGT